MVIADKADTGASTGKYEDKSRGAGSQKVTGIKAKVAVVELVLRCK